jgi:multidrug efflux system membrane fusion protein
MRNILFIAIALTVSALLLSACGRKQETREDSDKTRIKTVIVNSEKVVFPVHASGILVPAKEIRLSFKTGGIINTLYADDGTRVKKGELLATLYIAEIEAHVIQARNGYDKALRDFTRAQNLYKDSVVTLEQLQNTKTALNVAKAVQDAAIFNLDHSKIVAPENGVILKRLAQVHEVIGAGYPVFVFGTSDTHWKIKASLADRDYVRVQSGDPATVTFDAYPGEEFKAIVTLLSEASNPMTGTYEIELELVPVNYRLASGFLARVEITPRQKETYYRIPVEALVEADGQKGFVYVINDSLYAIKTEIKIAEIFDTWVAVDTGIKGGEIVATDGAAYLTEGTKVEITE